MSGGAALNILTAAWVTSALGNSTSPSREFLAVGVMVLEGRTGEALQASGENDCFDELANGFFIHLLPCSASSRGALLVEANNFIDARHELVDRDGPICAAKLLVSGANDVPGSGGKSGSHVSSFQ